MDNEKSRIHAFHNWGYGNIYNYIYIYLQLYLP